MLELVDPQLTGIPALVAVLVGLLAFVVSLSVARRRREAAGAEDGAKRELSSWIGIGIQGLGFMAAGFGPLKVETDPMAPFALAEGAGVALLVLTALLLFTASARAMGKNWSLVARTREDHQLVTSGPFAWVRHPIYSGLFAWLLAMGIAFGHYRGLAIGVVLYWIGTWIRIVREERLLRAQFGAAYDAYAARVKRFVPGII